ncbi:DNA mismatch repair protein MutS [Paenibacillus sp. 32O-W]|uniref:endonuclease MutS2 n=1 Tax=Paenibacillus sp. 32O-W TaxID=1695218 RepID=UPI0007228FDD|nr:DNA mismatch repair protein MutS [Paenibacillus sp. 32O-W]ALS27969.1 DNA mismatch repair protein MutS [Paenibacillus sp. 32O-W]
MNASTLERLEYNRIRAMLADYTVSPEGRQLAERHEPETNPKRVRAWLNETSEAAALLATGASVPLSAMEGVGPLLSLLGKSKIYNEQELGYLSAWLQAIAQMKRYMNGKRMTAPTLCAYADWMDDCRKLREELERCIRHGVLTDEASPELSRIRRNKRWAEAKIERRVNEAMSKYKKALQEPIVSKRKGHYVIPVRREHRKLVPGTVWDESASGQTLFVEPADVASLQAELEILIADEERERSIILAGLSELADAYAPALRQNLEAMASFDFIMARGKLSRSYGGRQAELSDRLVIRLVQAKHPLLGESAVPIDAEIGEGWKQLMITGPNTGGKTVALKTIGLLALMVQSGLFVPVGEGSRFGIFRHIMADVGDGQSIEQSLSTFSSHMKTVKEMLDVADDRSLLLLDELAAGTDPGEGIALSVAILEELLARGALTVATTHFNELKSYAAHTPGCMNARMAFDPDTLRPLYRMEIGEAGDSQAFVIARRYGLPEHVLRRAEQRLGGRVEQSSYLGGTAELADGKAAPSGQSEHSTKRKRSSAESGGKEMHDKETRKPFAVGDSVWIHPLKRPGIVFRPADERGQVIVQVQDRKLAFNHKRLAPYIPREKLYPGEGYDLDIVFDTKANRKARKLMSRKYTGDLTIVTPPDHDRG